MISGRERGRFFTWSAKLKFAENLKMENLVSAIFKNEAISAV